MSGDRSGGGAKGGASGPPSGEPLDDVDRLTLGVGGPPLSLPGEDPDEESSRDLGPGIVAGPAGGVARAPSDRADAPSEGDGWTRDRLRRGSDLHARPTPQPQPPPAAAAKRRRRRDSLVPGAAEETEALQLVDRRRPSRTGIDLASEMQERFALGDFTGALRAAELVLGRAPRHEAARNTAREARARLVALYSARLGSGRRVPKINVPDSEVRWLGLDNRAGFLLSRVDGSHSVEEIVDMSGMERLEALKLLAELLDAGAIRFDA